MLKCIFLKDEQKESSLQEKHGCSDSIQQVKSVIAAAKLQHMQSTWQDSDMHALHLIMQTWLP